MLCGGRFLVGFSPMDAPLFPTLKQAQSLFRQGRSMTGAKRRLRHTRGCRVSRRRWAGTLSVADEVDLDQDQDQDQDLGPMQECR